MCVLCGIKDLDSDLESFSVLNETEKRLGLG